MISGNDGMRGNCGVAREEISATAPANRSLFPKPWIVGNEVKHRTEKEHTMKSNSDLQTDVQNALKWEPQLHAAEIGVSVKEGVVTLTGTVDSYSKKCEAEHAAKNVAGVAAVVEKIEVDFGGNATSRNDNEVAQTVVDSLKWNWKVPPGTTRVAVEKGWVTLEGELEWNYQKEGAGEAVRHLLGVRGITNDIVIKSESQEQIEKEAIEGALKRNWSIDDSAITVSASGHQATLTGTVDSWYQKEEAGRVAWNAPGIWVVDNKLVVESE
jgi:osmotically-inducible protein OsmY